ncbi:sensor histidine kinase [Pontibacillus litoralis]|uniref:Sensor histidine kinase n=1 Tax=Pontibacillus litoralis JSM 072002 TaxID=1385512 RepID=A0A0A5G6V3_9BACI|nr:sensor histidine kinase [Pontibacillus litoralis]KGX86835.1 histidine kinase [Pontibacillus litoralis JSM 072002]
MMFILRQTVIGIGVALLCTIFTVGLTFYVFPLQQWTDLWNKELIDVPYIVFILSFSVLLGIIGGWSFGWVWNRRLHNIQRHLDELITGRELTLKGEKEQPFIQMNKRLQKLEIKMKKQTETTQRLATKRAKEREQSLQEVVAQERSRLARELHDSVSQQLFAASMMMSAINETNPPDDSSLQKQLAMVEHMIQQSQLEMRALLLHLRPVPLKGKSLQEGVQDLLAELVNKVPIKVEWNIEDIRLEKGVEDQLFRILQEAISNTLRHANAEALHVMLIKRDTFIILRIVDDGIGFDVEQEKTSSYGLHNMQERAIEIGGNIKVVSVLREGTRIEVKVPQLKEVVAND